jgi:hypothetical protein
LRITNDCHMPRTFVESSFSRLLSISAHAANR